MKGKLKKIRKVGSLVLVLMFVFGFSAYADTISTSEFGTFSWWTDHGTSNGMEYCQGYTYASTLEDGARIYITAEMVDALTGITIQVRGDSSGVANCCDATCWNTAGADHTMTYTCHEARGVSSVVRYKSVYQ